MHTVCQCCSAIRESYIATQFVYMGTRSHSPTAEHGQRGPSIHRYQTGRSPTHPDKFNSAKNYKAADTAKWTSTILSESCDHQQYSGTHRKGRVAIRTTPGMCRLVTPFTLSLTVRYAVVLASRSHLIWKLQVPLLFAMSSSLVEVTYTPSLLSSPTLFFTCMR